MKENNMKLVFGTLIFLTQMALAQNSIVGQWKTIDDGTHKPKSIIEIFEQDGVYNGKIVKLFREPTEDQNPKCDKCTGDKKDQLIIGMQNLNGLKKDSDTEWSGGEILDPKNGKTYSCKAELIDGGKKLKMRGYIGISLLGRTQVWERFGELAADPAPAAAVSATTTATSSDSSSMTTTTDKPAETKPAPKKPAKKAKARKK
jgi:uncharacterized protein (DUF2147 family)